VASMPRTRHLLLAALFATIALFVACSDDEGDATPDARVPQTSSDAALAAYFSDIEAAKTQHDELLPPPMTVLAGGQGAPPSAQEQIDFLIDNLTQDNVAITGMLTALEGLAIPTELASEHGEVLRTLIARLQFQETLIEQFRTGQRESPRQINRREGNIREGGGALCVIQSEAAHYGVEINLGCDVEDVLKLRRVDRTTEQLVTGEAGCNPQSLGEPAVALATFVDFLNRRAETVDIYQITGDGERVFVLSLAAGAEHIQVTYFETRWMITDADGECIGTYTARDVGTNVAITPENPND